jgi:hypothetical protein
MQLVKGYQNPHHMNFDDLTFVKKCGVKKFIFSDFEYFKSVTGPHVMEARGHAYIMIEEVKSNHNNAIRPVSLFIYLSVLVISESSFK